MPNYLLDTHVLLWYATASPRLNPATRALLLNPENQVFVSVTSIWEIGIKQELGKLTPLPQETEAVIAEAGFRYLNITLDHAKLAGRLPLHHRDPFDRMLIAQAQVEGLILITDDWKIERYGTPTLRP